MSIAENLRKKLTQPAVTAMELIAGSPQGQAAAAAMTPVQSAAIQAAKNEMNSQRQGTPTLAEQYMNEANNYLDQYRQGTFQYDLYADPAFLQARDSAMRQGNLAAKNVQAQSAQLTGGYGNSYGAMAAQQQYNQALQNVNEMVPELQNAAYNRYLNDQNRNLQLAQIYMNREEDAYNRAMNEAQLAAQYGDYGRLNAMGVNTSPYEAQQAEDRAWELRQRGLTEGQLAAQYGDYRGLNRLGIDTSQYESKEALDRAWEEEQKAWAREDRTTDAQARALQIALQKAQYQDYSALEALGFDMSSQRQKDLFDIALKYAQLDDYSLLRELGVDTTLLEAQKAKSLATALGYGTTSSGGRNTSGGKGSKDNDGGGEDEAALLDWFNEPWYDETAILRAKDVALEEGNRNLTYSKDTSTVTAKTKDGKTFLYKYDPSTGKVIKIEVEE